jgi:hypothetical protein
VPCPVRRCHGSFGITTLSLNAWSLCGGWYRRFSRIEPLTLPLRYQKNKDCRFTEWSGSIRSLDPHDGLCCVHGRWRCQEQKERAPMLDVLRLAIFHLLCYMHVPSRYSSSSTSSSSFAFEAILTIQVRAPSTWCLSVCLRDESGAFESLACQRGAYRYML